MSTITTPRIFLTGATGFVGGSILSALYKAYPDAYITTLVRTEANAKALQAAYSNVTPIIGTLSSLSILSTAAAAADFVIHISGENIPAVCAMIDGLASSSFSTDSPVPRLISLTGPRCLIDRSLPITGTVGSERRIWSDVADAHTILSFPKERWHAESDQAIVAHGIAKGVGAMLVSPGQLWGQGHGLLKQESHAAEYYAAAKKRGRAFVIGDGSATWSWCSIGDLSEAVVFLVTQALSTDEEERRRVGINEEGYYFVQSGDVNLMERAVAVTKRLGLGEVESITVGVAEDIHPYGPVMWGCGERFRADRLMGLGWRPKELAWRVLMEEGSGERA